MTWHLRDTTRLREVTVSGDSARTVTSPSYWEWAPKLLSHLAVAAPSLRSLSIIPPRGRDLDGGPRPYFLPLIGALSRLDSLALREWEYTEADIAGFTHFTRLQNLKVASPCRRRIFTCLSIIREIWH